MRSVRLRLLTLATAALLGLLAPSAALAQALVTQAAYSATQAQRGGKALLRALRTAPEDATGAQLWEAVLARDGLVADPAVSELLGAVRDGAIDWSAPYLEGRPQLVTLLRAVESLPAADVPLVVRSEATEAAQRLAADCDLTPVLPSLARLEGLGTVAIGAPTDAVAAPVDVVVAAESLETPALPSFTGVATGNLLLELRGSVIRGHEKLGTSEARQYIYDMSTDGNGYVVDLYLMRRAKKPGYPDNRDINVEHTWPRSRSKGWDARSTGASKLFAGDMHNLFPVDATWNSQRGHMGFGVVAPHPALHRPRIRSHTFEPPDSHKGRVARAMFYMALRYRLDIPASMEATFRDWHRQYPADDYERSRNNLIEQIQGNRNPFIDHEELVDRIARFADFPKWSGGQ